MNEKEIISKTIEKREFSQLPKKDVLMAFRHFERRQTGDEEKIRLTRELLHKVFGAFGSKKLFGEKGKPKSAEWILRKHISTRERLSFYGQVYSRILKNFDKKVSVIDLGCGVNGFSYDFFKKKKFNVEYVGIEATGQFVKLMNDYFKKQKIKGKVIHMSLFEIKKIKKLIKDTKKPRIAFLFKTIDSLEILNRNYSKKLIEELSLLVDRIVVSFATESFIKRKRFNVNREWILNFIRERFKIKDDFELGGERYLVFENKK